MTMTMTMTMTTTTSPQDLITFVGDAAHCCGVPKSTRTSRRGLATLAVVEKTLHHRTRRRRLPLPRRLDRPNTYVAFANSEQFTFRLPPIPFPPLPSPPPPPPPPPRPTHLRHRPECSLRLAASGFT